MTTSGDRPIHLLKSTSIIEGIRETLLFRLRTNDIINNLGDTTIPVGEIIAEIGIAKMHLKYLLKFAAWMRDARLDNT
jgi:hypothetical protein